MKKKDFLIITLMTGICLLYAVQIVQGVAHATSGFDLASTQDQILTLKAKNSLLREQVLDCMALPTIEAKAKLMGFVEAEDKNYLILR